MKKLLSGLLCLVCSQILWAQDSPLQFDESNKYVYYRIVEMPNTTADTLYQRAFAFAKSLTPKNKPAKGKAAYALNTKGSFLLYSGGSIVKKESGAVTYTLNIEAKDQKFRYKLSDFIFTPYKRDRVNNMTAQPGIEIPAEKLTSKLSAKEANVIITQIASFCETTGQKLKLKMEKATILQTPVPAKKISTDNW